MLQDLRWGFRMLLRNPGFSLLAVLALGLGIGGTTTIFSVVNAVLLNPFPYDNPEELVVVWERNLERNLPTMYASPPNFRDWSHQNNSFQALAGFSGGDYAIAREQGAIYIPGARVSSGLFELLGARPLLGRTFAPEEDRPGAEPAVILAYDTWNSVFGGRREILGARIELNGQPRTIVGVMPPGFNFPPRIVTEGTEPSIHPGLWVPFAIDYGEGRSAHYMTVVGRLKQGISLAQARIDLNQLARQLAKQYPDSNEGWDIILTPLRDQVVGEIRTQLWILLGAVAFVLLIACVNVANFLLARGMTRSREFAIRTALGANHSRVIRQLLIESQYLAVLGGLTGLLLTYGGIQLVIGLAPGNIPRLQETVIDARVLFFTLLLCMVTGLLFGLTPALRGFSHTLEPALRAGGRGLHDTGNSALRAGLVVSEVAFSLILLVGAGLLFQSFLQLRLVPTGFQSSDVLTSKLILPQAGFPDSESWSRSYREIAVRARNLPGVEAAGLIFDIPLGADRQGTGFLIQGEEPERARERNVNFSILTPGYFEAMNIKLLQGRYFRENDDSDSEPVMIINRVLAERFFEGDAVGRRIYAGFEEQVARRVVGIVDDVRHNRLSENPTPTMYVPFFDIPWSRRMTLVTRSTLETGALIQSLRSTLGQVDRGIAFYDARPMNEVVSDSVAQPRFAALMMGVFSCVALILATLGIYGVISFTVSRRVHETGIRMVLGAQKRDILRLILGQGMRLVLMGVGLGVVAALALARLLQAFLFGVSSSDAATYLVVSLLLTGVALLACYIPALRATRLNPVIALRQ